MSLRPRCNIFYALLVASLAVLLASASHQAFAKAEPVRTSIEIDHPLVLASEDRLVYVLVRFEVSEPVTTPGKDRPPLNIALVLDRSGSMEEASKLPYLKKAAKAIVGRMTLKDRLAIVEYDNRVTVAWPSAPVESPALIAKVIDALEPRGSTDLVAGMLEGISQVREYFRDSTVNRVLLLSDGLANRGITDPLEIRRLAHKARRQGVPVSTLGLGLKYDEDLMQDIAQSSGGAYHYIENPTEMTSIFQRELSTLIRTAARDVDIRFVPGDAVKGIQVFGYVTRSEEGTTVIEFPDFYAGEQRTLVLRLKLKASSTGPLRLGVLHLAYDDVGDGSRVEQNRELAVEVSRDAEKVRHAAVRDAIVEAALVEAEAEHESSLRLLGAGHWKDAQRRLEELAADLAVRNADIDDVRLAKKIEALEIESRSVVDAGLAPTSTAAYLYVKRSKQRLYEAKTGHRGLYMLKLGDGGHEVERLQRAMKNANVYAGPLDGRYTPDVESAVKAYQSDNNLAVDGVAGPATLRALGLY